MSSSKRSSQSSQKTSRHATNTSQAETLAQLAAISRVMATIHFDLQGNILDANDNFLRAVGYTKEEIIGKHHRIFVDPEYAASGAYAEFWQRLRAGQADSAEFRRVRKDGSDVFLQASYNPLFDADGKPYKVVKYATDITQQKLANLNYQGQLAAINRSMATIEFSLDGTVTEANPNFLQALGYTREEVVGKHHSMFVPPEYAASAEYRRFWHQLRAGEAQTAEFVRVGKGGREVYIQASYNPILDARGKPCKVVKYATDVTAQKVAANKARQESERALAEIERVLNAAAQSDLTQRIDPKQFDGFLRQVGEGLNRLVDSVSESFQHVKVTVQQIGQASTELGSTSQMMSSGALELNRAAESSSTSLDRAATMVRSNAENAAMANQLVSETAGAAQGGQERMQEMSAAMNDINASAQQIAKIIKVIDEIAFQTNLLALNAAVEAARAGRHGKGFAVVAQEVRSLAERSAKAAKETAELIESAVGKVAHGVRIAGATGSALEGILKNVSKVVDLVGEIAAASDEQSKTIELVSQSMTQVTENAQSSSQQSTQVAAAAVEMSRQMDLLRQRVEAYKLAAPAKVGAVSADLMEQLSALLAARGISLTPKLLNDALTADSPNGHANGHTNGSNGAKVDPRVLLPLDNDERGFKGF